MALDAVSALMAKNSIMPKAALVLRRRVAFEDGSFVALRAWSVPSPVPPSRHDYKYSMVYIVEGKRVIGYDNERGKGDHRHIGDTEVSYTFFTLERLLDDFASEVETVRNSRHEVQRSG